MLLCVSAAIHYSVTTSVPSDSRFFVKVSTGTVEPIAAICDVVYGGYALWPSTTIWLALMIVESR